MDFSTATPGQLRSIQHVDGPLLICAGAGSGKTFTLTQRIAWALLPGSGSNGEPYLSSIDEALIITFTNKAAGEIKDRIRRTLQAEGLVEEALKVDSAWISTIHSMCNRILTEHALEIGLDPSFTLSLGPECTIAQNQAIALALEKIKHDSDQQQAYHQLLSIYTTDDITQMLKGLLEAAANQTGGLDMCTQGPKPTPLAQACFDALESASYLAETGTEKNQIEATRIASEIQDWMQKLSNTSDCVTLSQRILEILGRVQKRQLSGKKATDFKDALAALESCAHAHISYGALGELRDLASHVQSLYEGILADLRLMDASSIIRYTLKAFREHPEIAASYQQRFKLVMVDEFQDTSQLQIDMIEEIVGKTKQHLCTVGDAQQSIYRFQGADVDVYFAHKRDMHSDSVGAREEHLVDNFRSHGDVLALVRAICGQKDYFLEDFLDLSAATPGVAYLPQSPRVEVILTHGTVNTDELTRSEARQIAARFEACLAAGHQAKDLVILMGSLSKASVYAEALRERGIACIVSGGSRFFESRCVQACLSLIKVLANPYDSEQLLSLLTGDILPVTSEDLLLLATSTCTANDTLSRQNPARGLIYPSEDLKGIAPSPLLQHAYSVLQRAWNALGKKPAHEVFMQVVVESGWLARLKKKGIEGIAQAADVLKFARLIRENAEQGMDMARCAQALTHRAEFSSEKPGVLSSSSQNAVRIMTIHASKGLEFPVVAVCDCYTTMPHRGKLECAVVDGKIATTLLAPHAQRPALDPELGSISCVRGASVAEEFASAVHALNAQREYEERKRLFYVAATRASAAVYLCLKHKDTKTPSYKQVEADILSGLFPGALDFPESTCTFHYGGSEPGLFTRTLVEDSEPSLPSYESTSQQDIYTEEQPNALTEKTCDDEACSSTLFIPMLNQNDPVTTVPVAWRADFYSYSSLASSLGKDTMPPGEVLECHNANNLNTYDIDYPSQQSAHDSVCLIDPEEPSSSALLPDEATSFGSAFHQICEWMAYAPQIPSEEELLDYLSRTGKLWDIHDMTRLHDAVTRWRSSDLCHSAFSYTHHNPEVPFFVHVGDDVLEGSIDLLCSNDTHRAVVIDYKTGGSPHENTTALQQKHLLQAQCYALALFKSGYSQVEAYFVRVEIPDLNGQPQIVQYRFEAAQASELERSICSLRAIQTMD